MTTKTESRLCPVEGCEARAVCRGYCDKHLKRILRLGTTDLPAKPTLQERFWSKVRFTETCWLWTASTTVAGYGQFFITRSNRSALAHRLSYEWLVGTIPEGLQLDHLCRTPRCVNPHHLEPVTRKENILRGTSPMADQARRTHCIRGHEFTPDNTYRSPQGARQCRICNRLRDARKRERKAEWGPHVP